MQLENFCNHYVPFTAKCRFLNWDVDAIVNRYSPLLLVDCDFIQDFSADVFDNASFSLHFDIIDEKLTALSLLEHSERLVQFGCLFVHDLLIAASLVPTKAFAFPARPHTVLKHEMEVNWFALRIISLHTMIIALSELLAFLADLLEAKRDLSNLGENGQHISFRPMLDLYANYRFSHPDVESLMATMQSISMLNFTAELRDEIKRYPLFQTLSRSRHIAAWMFSSRSFEEQHYLNTCEISAIVYAVASHHHSIASLLAFVKRTAKYCMDRVYSGEISKLDTAYFPLYGEAPLLVEFTVEKITQLNLRIAEIESNIRALNMSLEGKTNLEESDFLEMNQLYLALHAAIQEASAVFNHLKPVTLTPKLFTNKWHLSALTMYPLCSLTQYIPGFPPSESRCLASGHFGKVPCYRFMRFVNKIEAHWDGRFFEYFANSLRACGDKTELKRKMRVLWKKVHLIGGALFASSETVWTGWEVGHLSFFQAIRLPKRENGNALDFFRQFEAHAKRPYFRQSEFYFDEHSVLQCHFSEYDFAHGRNNGSDNHNGSLNHDRSTNKKLNRETRFLKDSSDEDSGDEDLEELFFLVSDPEIKHSKVCTLDQMLEHILDEEVGFDFENVLGSFYHY